ncbi:hypothetical protein M405DRAFT_165414 [Rhizopogon salebrosus TDB-379]|nr:hypothetical protein M405DRAFT_165414 [Rhizopogon salebrosus TDB-379]
MRRIKFLDSQPSTPHSSTSEAGARVHTITVRTPENRSSLQRCCEQFTIGPPQRNDRTKRRVDGR